MESWDTHRISNHMVKLFRPKNYSKYLILRHRLEGGTISMRNFQVRNAYKPAFYTKHQAQFAKRFWKLHYLAVHAPDPVRKQWINVYKNFYKKHFGDDKASTRFLNKYTCWSWL